MTAAPAMRVAILAAALTGCKAHLPALLAGELALAAGAAFLAASGREAGGGGREGGDGPAAREGSQP